MDAMEFVKICDENGCVREEDAMGLSIEDVQILIETIEDIIGQDEKNLKVLKEVRSKLALNLFETEYKGRSSFDTEGHTFSKIQTTKVSGKLMSEKQSLIWKQICNKDQDMLSMSQKSLREYLKARGMNNEEIEKLVNEVCVLDKPTIKAKKRN